ncbi:MAG TPA: hypothetical protein VIF64_00145 [Pyrinomonadaceae bacterium]
MGTGSTIVIFVSAAALLAVGVLMFIMSVKKMATSFAPRVGDDGSPAITNAGRLKVFLFLIIGLLVASGGVALLITGIVRVTS